MTLEERYKAATVDSYVGRVKTFQAAATKSDRGVDFMDGDPRSGTAVAPDKYQTEFTRNAPGSFRYGGGGKTAGAVGLTRWLPEAFKIAFEGSGPVTLSSGYWGNTKFTLLNNLRNANVTVHNYAPIKTKTFTESLSNISRPKVNGSVIGPTPAGLNG